MVLQPAREALGVAFHLQGTRQREPVARIDEVRLADDAQGGASDLGELLGLQQTAQHVPVEELQDQLVSRDLRRALSLEIRRLLEAPRILREKHLDRLARSQVARALRGCVETQIVEPRVGRLLALDAHQRRVLQREGLLSCLAEQDEDLATRRILDYLPESPLGLRGHPDAVVLDKFHGVPPARGEPPSMT